MILGIGADLVALPALAEQMGRPGSRFLAGALTARERRAVRSRVLARGASPEDPAELAPHVGARWAAKEAVVKAWSAALAGIAPPIAPESVDWHDIEVVQDHWGRPSVALRGHVAAEVERTLGGGLAWHLSVSHDGSLAQAVAILERPGAGAEAAGR